MKSWERSVAWGFAAAVCCSLLSGCVGEVAAGGAGDVVATDSASAGPLATPSAAAGFEPVDGGAREGAGGEAVLGDQERVEAYLVAKGDKLVAIAERFGVDVTELTKANGVRHDYNDGELHPGEYVLFREQGAAAGPVYRPPLVDSGVREHAAGEVVVDEGGAIVKYVVAEGDRGDEIGLRLGTEARQIFHDSGEFEGQNILNWGQIYPGDVLRFTAQP
ncbi:LysM peptidoglycan-binding domain-containing protein [Herbiconiux sp.]|uniref:LysM peptidoglycan-binding domain-containing protein n=1 Tax=Herbiconiux sp. TaxID=1871186 RepID=UPI0025BD3AE8|nr:LysM peptidoglycan-binding domain-containing protein [Herbiconiux sp.]